VENRTKQLSLGYTELSNVGFEYACVVFHPVGSPEAAHAACENDKNCGHFEFSGLADSQNKKCQRERIASMVEELPQRRA